VPTENSARNFSTQCNIVTSRGLCREVLRFTFLDAADFKSIRAG